VQQKLADVATSREENIVGVHVVKAFAQSRPRRRSSAAARGSVPKTLQANLHGRSTVPLISFVAMIAKRRCCSSARAVVSHGNAERRRIRPFNLYLGMLVTPLRSSACGSAGAAATARRRIFEVMDEPGDPAARSDRPAPGPGHVRFEHIDFEYLDAVPCCRTSTSICPPVA